MAVTRQTCLFLWLADIRHRYLSELVMTARTFTKSLLTMALAFAALTGAQAASQQFYADQLTAATPADARDDFLRLAAEIKLEGFEALLPGIPTGPLRLFEGNGSLTQDEFSIGLIKQGDVQNGRFNTTPGCNITTHASGGKRRPRLKSR